MWVGPGAAYAALDPHQPINSLLHQSWQTAQGLPQNSVLALAQTENGYIWVGTEEGLARFDGNTFSVYSLRNSGLPNKTVTSLFPAGKNALWIGTNGGGLARLENDHFTVYTAKNGLSANAVLCLYQDKHGVLWIGTDGGGLVRFENGSFRAYSKADGLADNSVFSLAEDSSGTLWIGTHNGFNTFAHEQLTTPAQNAELQSRYVPAICAASDGSIWLGTMDGLYVLHGQTLRRYTTADGLAANAVSSLRQDRAGSIWIGTSPLGLSRYANGRFESLQDPLAGKSMMLWGLLEDREGSIWFGVAGAGLHCLREAAVQVVGRHEGLPSELVLGTFQDREGGWWIGSDNGVTNLRNGHATTYGVRDGLPDSLVFSIAQDSGGTMWVATKRGIASIKDGQVRPRNEESGLGTMMVDCTFVDRAGNVWFGSRNGLTRFDGSRFSTLTTKDGLSNNYVLAIGQSTDGALWIGTAGGLNRWNNGTFQAWTTHNGLSSDVVRAVYADADNSIWFSSNGGGLSHLQNGALSTVTTDGGLYDDSLFSILDDQDGHLWMSSNRGIFSIAKKQFIAVASGRLHLLTPVIYGTADGMKSRECNGGFQPAGWRLRDGRIAFPTMAGLAVLTPHGKNIDGQELAATIEHVLVDGKERGIGASLEVPPGRGQLEFEFTAPAFIHANSVQFSYMLDGFDKDWTPAQNRRVADYTNIPPGRYRFKVRAGSGDNWRDRGTALDITLQPHFYETLPFFILIGMAVVGSCAGIYSWRVNQLKRREQELLRLVNERTAALQESERQVRRSRDELEIRVQERTIELVRSNHALESEILVRRHTEAQLTSAKEAAEQASQAKSDFLANISHEIRTPINGILGMTEIALTTRLEPDQQEYLEIVKSSADSLMEIVNSILDFSNIGTSHFQLKSVPFSVRDTLEDLLIRTETRATAKNLQFSSFIAAKVPSTIAGDPDRVTQVAANLLDNAIKFTQTGYVRFELYLDGDAAGLPMLHFSVTDTGIGISPEKQKTIFEPFTQADNSSTRRYGGTGLGLTIASQIAALMGGKLWVESDGRTGSVFHFTTKCLSVANGNGGPASALRSSLQPVA